MINLYVPASKVSNLCGQNKFTPQEECFFNAYKKNNVDQYNKLLRKLKREDKNEQNKKIIKSLNVEKELETAISSTKNSDRTKALKHIQQKIEQKFESMPEEQQKKLIKNVKKQADTYIKTEIGTNREEISLDNFETSEGISITSRNDELFYGHIKSDNVNLKIGGKIDGVNEKEKVLIEHKQRLNRLFDSIPLYEKWQLMLYLYFLSLEKAILIQTYKDQQISMEFEWSDEFWEIVVKKIRESLEKYYVIVSDPKKLERLVKKYTVPKIEKKGSVPITNFFTIKK